MHLGSPVRGSNRPPPKLPALLSRRLLPRDQSWEGLSGDGKAVKELMNSPCVSIKEG